MILIGTFHTCTTNDLREDILRYDFQIKLLLEYYTYHYYGDTDTNG
jgi:hypothetical protein